MSPLHKLVLFQIICLQLASSLPPNGRSPVKVSKHPKLVVFSYDGFRYDYLTKTETPNLDSLKASGVTTAYMIPQFSSFTFPNHQSLSTGLNTQSHGIVANSVWDPLYGETLSGFTDQIEFWKYNEAVAPLWILNEWAGDGRHSGTQFPGSDHPHGLNDTVSTFNLSYDEDRTYEERMDYVLAWLTDELNPANLIFMYFDEPDKEGHAFGPNSEEVKGAIRRMDGITGYFMDRLKELELVDQVNLIFWSDHGMEEVVPTNEIDIESIVDRALYTRYGTSPVVQVWPINEATTESMYEEFLAGSEGKQFSVYRKSELPARWKYGESRRVSPIVLVSEPGWIFNGRPDGLVERAGAKDEHDHQKKANQASTLGFHGYDNESPNMRAFFIATGPAFKSGVEIEPFENVDLFPLICHLMGFPAPGNNGTLSNVQAALADETGLGNSRGLAWPQNRSSADKSRSGIIGIGALFFAFYLNL